jgi:hypothetical protein
LKDLTDVVYPALCLAKRLFSLRYGNLNDILSILRKLKGLVFHLRLVIVWVLAGLP